VGRFPNSRSQQERSFCKTFVSFNINSKVHGGRRIARRRFGAYGLFHLTCSTKHSSNKVLTLLERRSQWFMVVLTEISTNDHGFSQ